LVFWDVTKSVARALNTGLLTNVALWVWKMSPHRQVPIGLNWCQGGGSVVTADVHSDEEFTQSKSRLACGTASESGMTILWWRNRFDSTRARITMRLLRDQRLAMLPSAAVTTIVALVLIFSPSAQAGCSHLVTSRADRFGVSGLTESLIRDLADRSNPDPTPSHPRPCSGAFCSGQPASPTVPAGVTDGQNGNWALCWPSSSSTVAVASFRAVGTTSLRPVHRETGVFHPPRHIRRSA